MTALGGGGRVDADGAAYRKDSVGRRGAQAAAAEPIGTPLVDRSRRRG